MGVGELHGAIGVDDEHGRHWELGRAVGVALADFDAERALGLEDVVGLLKADAELPGDARAGVGEDGELQAVLLGRGERLVGLLRADRRERRAVGGESRDEL